MKRKLRTPAWGDNPWPRNAPDRCPKHVREKHGHLKMKGRCMLPLGHKGRCSLIDDGR